MSLCCARSRLHVYGDRSCPPESREQGSIGSVCLWNGSPATNIMLEKNKDFSLRASRMSTASSRSFRYEQSRVRQAVERGEVDAMPLTASGKAASGDSIPRGHQQGLRAVSAPRLGGLQHRQAGPIGRPSGSGLSTARRQVIMMGLVTPSPPDHAFSPLHTKDVNMYDVNLERPRSRSTRPGIRQGRRLLLRPWTTPRFPPRCAMAEYLKPQLAKVGIDARSTFLTSARGPNGCPTTISSPTTFNWATCYRRAPHVFLGQHREGRLSPIPRSAVP